MAFLFHLYPQERGDSFPWRYFMRESARHVKVEAEEHMKFRYMESVYLNGIPKEHLGNARLMKPENLTSDIQLWVEKTEELLDVARDLDIPPMMLVDYLPNEIPEGFFDLVRAEANQTNQSVEHVLASWRNTEK
jgi:hypothetical protein